MNQKHVLVINGHPDLQHSNANSSILNVLQQLPSVEVRNLHKLYPNYQINVSAEQEALKKADVIVLQFPLFWYSVPAILKLWIDEVFTFGFAYGTGGDKLKGKKVIFSFTTGGNQEAYSPKGYNRQPVTEYIKPFEQIAYLVQMEYHTMYSLDNLYVPGMPTERLEEVKKQAVAYAQKLVEKIKGL